MLQDKLQHRVHYNVVPDRIVYMNYRALHQQLSALSYHKEETAMNADLV